MTLNRREFVQLGSEAIGVLLRNQLYAGIVDVPEDGVRNKRGDFDPLVSESVFFRDLWPAASRCGQPRAATSLGLHGRRVAILRRQSGMNAAGSSYERRRHAKLEPVRIVELEHARAPRTVRRLAEQRSTRGLDPRSSRVHIGSTSHVDLQVEALSLDPVPTELAIVLVEDDVAITRGDHRRNDLPFVLERLSHRKPDGITVEANRRLQVLAGDRAAQIGRVDCGRRIGH